MTFRGSLKIKFISKIHLSKFLSDRFTGIKTKTMSGQLASTEKKEQINDKKPIFKSPILCIGAFLMLVAIAGFFWAGSTKKLSAESLTAGLSPKYISQDLFAESAKNFIRESPEMVLIQSNSALAITPPVTVSAQTLGDLLGTSEVSASSQDRKESIEYIVEDGDTLSSVAEKFNISTETILWANNLSKGSVIKEGQSLVILPVSGVMYMVQKGDTLSDIAGIYKGKTDQIVAFNGLSGEADIFIGDLLIIPDGKIPIKAVQPVLAPLAESYFMIPCEGIITQTMHTFNAVDVANSCGKPIIAAAGGTVQRTGLIAIGGNRVTILHPNGVVTYYGHLSSILVQPGQSVSQGEIIGYMGQTGNATGCHLHFEVRGAKNFLSKYLLGAHISW
jgi:LysM repeat protein